MSDDAALEGARVAVTGGAGFLGRAVCARLASVGAIPLVPRRAEVDLRDAAAAAGWFRAHRPDLVVHAAASGGGIGWMRAHPATSFADIVLLNTVVLDVAWRAGVRRLVGVSSACAYAADAAQPMREEALFAGEPEPTNGPYGHAKRALLVHGAALHAEHAFDCAFVVPTNLYGPGDDFGPRSHVVAALIRRFEDARLAGSPGAADGCKGPQRQREQASVTCWGSGAATRDLLYVDDAADAIVALLARGGGPAPINLGSGEERTIAEIARACAEAVGYAGALEWDRAQPDGMPRKVLDVTRARARLGWAARVPLTEGLARTVAWYRNQQPR
jgi:GDP-L-fucose synthase